MIIDVLESDVRATPLDVLVLKYAETHRGADLAVALAMGKTPLAVDTGDHKFFPSNNRIEAKEVLVLGVGPLGDFDYREIAAFARKALQLISQSRPEARRIGITLHGPGYGLDELASIGSLVGGLVVALTQDHRVDGLGSGDFRVSIIETSSRRAKRIREYLNSAGSRPILAQDGGELFSPAAATAISSGGTYERRLFAAMPFNDDFLDHWELAIQPAAHENNVVIERLDHAHFTGEIVAEIRTRIERASAVVALLDQNNPNVFLEVGYAWGVRKPAVLLLKEGQDAPFDVRSQRLIRYSRIGDLKATLSRELKGLLVNAAI